VTMPSGRRRLVLTAHVATSVGWVGAVAAFLALVVAGSTSQHAATVRAAYLAMELTASWVIVPFAFASLLTGAIQGLGTPWGLLRHYWILAKLLITILATILLLVHLQPIRRVADIAAKATTSAAKLLALAPGVTLVEVGAALLALLVATTLAVWKPWGMTPYGRHRQGGRRAGKDQQPRVTRA
jgi:hypothetical protein